MKKSNKSTKAKKVILMCLILLLFAMLIFSVFFSIININNTNILKGIYISGIDVSGMSKEEAISTISKMVNDKSSNNIRIANSEYETNTTFSNLEINYNINLAVNEAFNLGRSGNIFENNFIILNLMLNKKNIDLKVELNNEKLEALMNDISGNLPNKLIQSSYYIEDDHLVITKGTSGEILDYEDFKDKLYNTLNDLTFVENSIDIKTENVSPKDIDIEEIYNEVHKDAQNAYYEKQPFKVYAEVKGVSFDKENAYNLLQVDQDEYIIDLTYSYPEITVNDLDIDIFKDTLSYFTTKYDMSNTDRSTNLELAASKINGTILSPGEEFSYNTIVGARTIESGYKEAKVYSNGQVVDGIGGGICQISSTLYNSAIYANLDITQRYNHQFVTSYVPAGRDATVVYGVKDLRFFNNRSFPIKIEIKVSNGIVTCSIYGIKEDTENSVDFDIETVSVTEPPIKYEYDNSMSIGKEEVKQYGSNGKVVNVYKVVKSNGSVISKTLISQDTYNALEKIIVKNSETN